VAASIALAGVCGGAAATAYEARKARRQFNSVRELANRFLFDFHDEIATVPGTVKAREMIVSTALEYLNRLAGEASRDPGLQWELAQAFAKVAKVQGSTNSPSLRRPRDGVASFEKALSLARPLADRRLLNTKQHEDLVNMLCDAEGFYWVIGRYDDAVRVGREAIARSDGLSSFMRGRPLGEMSITLSMSGDLAGSLEYVERLLPISRENARLDPSFINRRRLAETLDNLANTSLKLTALDGALAAGTEALGIFRSLAAERPDEPRARRSVIIALVHLGDILGAGDGPSLGRYAEAVERYDVALAVITPLLADPKDRSSQHDAGILRNKIAYTLRGLDPARAIREAAAATELMDTTSPDSPTSRAEPRIAGADAYRELRQYAQAERLLKEAGQVLKAPGSGDEAELALSEARLESARKGHGTGDRFQRAIALEEQVFQKAPRPANAWALARALELAAGALPESATGFRHRIEEVWNSQRQRYPGRAWIEMQWSESRAALSGR